MNYSEITGRIIGQCKDCYYFGVVKDGKTITYSRGYKMCHTSHPDNSGVDGNDNPNFGCWTWKPRNSKKKIVVTVKT